MARLSGPWCALLDAAASRLPFGALAAPTTEFRSEVVGADELLDCIQGIGWRDALKPCYDPESFRWLLLQAASARRHGALRMSVVRDVAGARVGWYVYYAQRGGESKALQVGAASQHFENVFQALLRDAWNEGATSVSGQAMPRFLLGTARRRCSFHYVGNGVLVHSRDADLLGCVLEGSAALSRLDGEWWTRFAVGDWDD
jgi:hypothetical protein